MTASTAPVYTDPATGLKLFRTRAEPRQDIRRTVLGVVADESLKQLPERPAGAVFDAAEQARYQEFKQARRGAAAYQDLSGEFSRYLDDVYTAAVVERDPLTDECDVLVVGAGFAGLVLWHKLRAAGFADVRFCERGGDVGGTWYWNRYPGIACDVEAYSYLPLLDDMGYIPSMKFASGFEIFEYCQTVAERIGFYEHCLFNTAVVGCDWDPAVSRWTVTTDRGDRMSARVVVLANGILTTPKLARIDGMETFEGESFHTSRWRYDVDLVGKRIGVIGTGATAVQVIPELAKVAGHLFVFQRTPSTIDVRDQRPTTADEIEEWSHHPGWARERRGRFAQISEGRSAMKANDDYLAGRAASFRDVRVHERELTAEELVAKRLDSNFRIMEQIRARIDMIVEDAATAAALKPYYPYGCKRPTFHDEYLPTFNRPNVTLVDTAPRGVTEIGPRGVVHGGIEYDVDVLVFATGFQWMATSTFQSIRDGAGRSLREKWTQVGTKTFLGLHSSGFPNLMIVTGPQGGGGSFNFTDAIETHTDYVVWMLTTMRTNGADVVDVTAAAEDEYAAHCRTVDLQTAPLRDCLSYYNGDGNAEPGSLGYYGGPQWHVFAREAASTMRPYVLQPSLAHR